MEPVLHCEFPLFSSGNPAIFFSTGLLDQAGNDVHGTFPPANEVSKEVENAIMHESARAIYSVSVILRIAQLKLTSSVPRGVYGT
jgi:hypothetical protein